MRNKTKNRQEWVLRNQEKKNIKLKLIFNKNLIQNYKFLLVSNLVSVGFSIRIITKCNNNSKYLGNTLFIYNIIEPATIS